MTLNFDLLTQKRDDFNVHSKTNEYVVITVCHMESNWKLVKKIKRKRLSMKIWQTVPQLVKAVLGLKRIEKKKWETDDD